VEIEDPRVAEELLALAGFSVGDEPKKAPKTEAKAEPKKARKE